MRWSDAFVTPITGRTAAPSLKSGSRRLLTFAPNNLIFLS
ncbi:hypothetical protein ACVIGA_000563 [Bradyrhizobium sp. USDA 3240]